MSNSAQVFWQTLFIYLLCYHSTKLVRQHFLLLLKGGGRSADLKLNTSAPLSLNHHTFLNTEPVHTKQSLMESLLNYIAFENKDKMVDPLNQ